MNSNAEVFYFDEIYGIDDQELIKAVSDHYPIYEVFRIDLADDD